MLDRLLNGPVPPHSHASVWLVMTALLAGYWAAAKFWGPSYVSPNEPAVSRRQARLFAAGVIVLWIGADWPIHDLGERYLFSVHMLQHMLFSLVGPPLLLMGMPDWLLRKLLKPKPIMAVMRRITRPVPAFFLFNFYMVVTHLPGFVNLVVHDELAHFSAHAVLVGVSLLMWWPVLSPLAELPRISRPAQLLYLFGQTIIPTVPASFLTFAHSPLYPVYAAAPRILNGFGPVADQAVAGILMKLGGGLLLWVTIAVKFFRMSADEEASIPDATDWQDLERELNEARAES
jgi:putative membrane protein